MKKYIILFIGLGMMLGSCEFDNYDEPTSKITGKIIYQGKTLGFRSNRLSLLLFQSGYQLHESENVAINQDGTFSAIMFDGDYKLINPAGTNQPWVLRTDTVFFELNGQIAIDYEVTPYFIINNESYARSGDNMTASCELEQIVGTSTLQSAALFISRTLICDDRYNNGSHVIPAGDITDLSDVNFTVPIEQRILDFGYCFVRVGVKVNQASEWLFTQVEKVEF
ncbi:MAG: DUF3823 domain-containing protein [Bacteroidales bacterium]